MTVAVAPQFNPFDPSFTESPYELYANLRDNDPVQYSDLLCGWVVTRYEDVAALLRDPTISSSVHSATPTSVTKIEIERLAEQPRAARTIVMMDDPDHARTRKLMAKPFRVAAIERVRGRGSRAHAHRARRACRPWPHVRGNRWAGRLRPGRGLCVPITGRDLLRDAGRAR